MHFHNYVSICRKINVIVKYYIRRLNIYFKYLDKRKTKIKYYADYFKITLQNFENDDSKM